MTPSYFSFDSVAHFLQTHAEHISELPDSRVKRAFLELQFALQEDKQMQEEKRERELLAKLKRKYEL